MDIVLNNVSVSYKGTDGKENRVIEDMNLNLKKGSLFYLKGGSGSGKSTFLNVVSGLILPQKGKMTLDGTDISTLSEHKRDLFRAKNIGYIFQTFNLLAPLNVLENVCFPAIITGKHTASDNSRAKEILDELGLKGYYAKPVYHLSVGQRQRVAVARVLFSDYSVVLADEPTASLDKISASIVKESLLKLNKNGTTVIIASHDSTFDSHKADVVYDFEKRRFEDEI